MIALRPFGDDGPRQTDFKRLNLLIASEHLKRPRLLDDEPLRSKVARGHAGRLPGQNQEHVHGDAPR